MTSTERLVTLGAILAGGLTWGFTLDVHAQPAASRPAEPAYNTAEGPMATPRPRPDGRFRLQLDDGSMVFGKLSAKQSWKLRSVVGEVSVPLEKVVSLEFQGDSKTAKVTFRNGDRITGELSLPRIKVETKWAELSLDPKHIKSMICLECLHAAPATAYPTPPSASYRAAARAPSSLPPSATPAYQDPR